MEKFKVTLLVIIYAVSLFITGLFVAVTISNPFRGKEFSVTATVFGLIFALITLYLKRQVTDSKVDIIESNTFKMAISNEGFVTAFEIAAKNGFRLKDVNSFLEKCCEKGLCEKRYIEESLVEVFYFRDSVSLELKRNSKTKSDIETETCDVNKTNTLKSDIGN